MGKLETFLAVLSLEECNNPGLIDVCESINVKVS